VIAPPSGRAPLRAVLDTNVLLSAIFFGGVPGRILATWQQDVTRHAVIEDVEKYLEVVGEPIDPAPADPAQQTIVFVKTVNENTNTKTCITRLGIIRIIISTNL
jgi:hypothetical protein